VNYPFKIRLCYCKRLATPGGETILHIVPLNVIILDIIVISVHLYLVEP